MKRFSEVIYQENRGVLKVFLDDVIRDSVTYTGHTRRKTWTAMDVAYALKRQGKTCTVSEAKSNTMRVLPHGFFS